MRSNFICAIAVAILLSACASGDPEEQTLGAFFGAVKSGDQVAVEQISLITFDGTVETWEIIDRGAESQGPFQLAELEAELEKMRDDARDQRQQNSTFISDNRDTYEAYTAQYAKDPSAPFAGELKTFHEELQERQGALAQLQSDAEQLAFDVDALKNAATLSVTTPVDENFEGQIKVKPIQVRVNDGSEDKTYTVVLHRYELTDTRQDRALSSRWIVAEVQPQG